MLLGRWVAIERSRVDNPPGALDVDEHAELERLRVGNAELPMDRAFLKKAAAFFVTENQNRCRRAGSWTRRRPPTRSPGWRL